MLSIRYLLENGAYGLLVWFVQRGNSLVVDMARFIIPRRKVAALDPEDARGGAGAVARDRSPICRP